MPFLSTSTEVNSSKATAASTGSVTSSLTVISTSTLPLEASGLKVFSPVPRTDLPSSLLISSAFRVYSLPGTRSLYVTVSITVAPFSTRLPSLMEASVSILGSRPFSCSLVVGVGSGLGVTSVVLSGVVSEVVSFGVVPSDSDGSGFSVVSFGEVSPPGFSGVVSEVVSFGVVPSDSDGSGFSVVSFGEVSPPGFSEVVSSEEVSSEEVVGSSEPPPLSGSSGRPGWSTGMTD